MLSDLERAKIVVTNYHAFMLRETMSLSSGNRALLEGNDHKMETLETEGQMVKRVMPELMGLRNVMVLNDEGHHCYREKPVEVSDEGSLTGDDRSEANENNKAARVWISGLEMVKRVIGVSQCGRPVGDAVFLARFWVRGGYVIPLDGDGFFVDGRD